MTLARSAIDCALGIFAFGRKARRGSVSERVRGGIYVEAIAAWVWDVVEEDLSDDGRNALTEIKRKINDFQKTLHLARRLGNVPSTELFDKYQEINRLGRVLCAEIYPKWIGRYDQKLSL